MTEFTEEKLAELRAVAEDAEPMMVFGGLAQTTFVSMEKSDVLALIAALEAKTAEVDDLETRLSEFLCEMTDNRLSKTGYDVSTMVTYAEEANQRWIDEAVKDAERERDEARAEVERLARIDAIATAAGKVTPCSCSAQRARTDRAEAALERVREAATEVTNQENNRVSTHYDNCWKQHLHCLAAKIIHETGADDE